MIAKETLKVIIQNNNLMHLATLNREGMTSVRGVDFVGGVEENILYFLTRKDSRKVADIMANDQVSVAIDHDCPSMEDLLKLQYLKATATCEFLENSQETQMAMGMFLKKFPYLENLPGEKSDFVMGKIRLSNVMVTDNTISFGHTEEINY